MADKTHIEWTDATWNPVTGCTKVSAGCKHCYAERDWARLSANPKTRYYGRAFTDVQCHDDVLALPLRWTKPRRIFVNSMSDLFHPDVSDHFIERVLTVTAHAPQHIFQILTKRPERMAKLMRRWMNMNERVQPNLWLGVSVEDQASADVRIPLLSKTPAAVLWISAEPLLGPIDLTPAYLPCPNAMHASIDPETGAFECCSKCDHTGIGSELGIDWVVVGGESGPQARPMHPGWVRGLRDQCASAGVPFLFKQWGEWLAIEEHHLPEDLADARALRIRESWPSDMPGVHTLFRFGKKAAGRLLDGQRHDQYPLGVPWA